MPPLLGAHTQVLPLTIPNHCYTLCNALHTCAAGLVSMSYPPGRSGMCCAAEGQVMHPLRVTQPWPYQQWWVAATSDEIGRVPLGRTILDEPVVLYRSEAGDAIGLAGICPHRSFPLAHGCLVGDNLRCGYHGFTFAPSGECVKIPTQNSVPKRVATVRRYPLFERGGLIWIWTGTEGQEDSSLLPDMEKHGIGSSNWSTEQHPRMLLACRYSLLIDNLMDLSHISYIHADTIPGGGAVVHIPPDIHENERSYNVQRIGRNLPSNEMFRLQFPDHEGAVTNHFDAEYLGPCMIRTGGRAYANDVGELLGTQNFLHFITPASKNSVHYVVLTSRDYGHDNCKLSNFLLNIAVAKAVVQDVKALENIESLLQSLRTPPQEVSCRADTGALKVRRLLESQIRAETETDAGG